MYLLLFIKITLQEKVSNHKIEDKDENGQEANGDNDGNPANFFEEPDESDGAYLVRNDMTGQVSIASYGAIKNVAFDFVQS